jgi:hypothetical protein
LPLANSVVDELAFVDLVFSKHSKKPSAWAHRGWCLKSLRGQGGGPVDPALLGHELDVTARVRRGVGLMDWRGGGHWLAVRAGMQACGPIKGIRVV